MNSNLKVIAGIGNPGEKYIRTLHNAGFWLIDEIASREKIEFSLDKRFDLQMCQVSLSGKDIWLIKPQKFMNLSGGPIGEFLRYFKIPTNEMIVAHDEIDLLPNTVKFKISGGHAGHNGLRDIIRHCDNDFMRIRIGVGHPGNKDEVIKYVLKNAKKSLRQDINKSIERAIRILPMIIQGNTQEAMKKLHTDISIKE
jgi:PTH1 family peptidyl-tRNA hydrolase